MPVAGLERKTNPQLVELILELRRVASTTGADIWADVADRLAKPAKLWYQVNVAKVGDVTGDGETALVCGKVLSTGSPRKGLRVAAFAFSEFARQKIEEAGGKCLTIDELVKQSPKGQGVRLVA